MEAVLRMHDLGPSATAYCSGYWPVPGNAKRSFEHYASYLPQTLQMLAGSRLWFYSNDADVLRQVSEICADHQVDLTAVLLDFQALPAWSIAADYVCACERMHLDLYGPPVRRMKEKGVNHYWRDLIGSGPESYRRVLAIWLSKVELTAALAARLEPGSIVAWVDASLARKNNARPCWDFTRCALPPGRLTHYPSQARIYGATLPLSAGFLAADAPTWSLIQEHFVAARTSLVAMPYGHDEETILSKCLGDHPELFHVLQADAPPATRPLLLRIPAALLGRLRRQLQAVRERG